MAKVLLIDDEPLVRDNIASYLEDDGHEVFSTNSAESGLMRMQMFKPDLVVVDLRLQGVNGEAFVHAAHNLNPSIQFIIHTGSQEYTVSQQLRERGINETNILYKPLTDLDELSSLIDTLLADAEAI